MTVRRAIAFVLISLCYFYLVLMLVGGLAYASVCHYPDVPGCHTDFTLVGIAVVVVVALYILMCWAFVRHVRRSPPSDE